MPTDFSLDNIAARLGRIKEPPSPTDFRRTPAAVAMIIDEGADGLELFFIQRAANEHDPWSGHIAFPGGKLEDGEKECQAACRETLEEVGIDLAQARYLGRLSDIIGENLPVRVSCCLFAMRRRECRPELNDEVRDAFWISLAELADRKRHLQTTVSFDEKTFEVPAILLPVSNKPVLWGITYRLVMQFMEIMADENGALHQEEGSTTEPGYPWHL